MNLDQFKFTELNGVTYSWQWKREKAGKEGEKGDGEVTNNKKRKSKVGHLTRSTLNKMLKWLISGPKCRLYTGKLEKGSH